MKTSILCLFVTMLCFSGFSQSKSKLELKAYADSYYAYFTDDRDQGLFQKYATVAGRDQQFSINIAQIGLHYTAKNIRSNVTLHAGDIVDATWSDRFHNIQEANVGIHLLPNWWLDIGLFTTHIGTESFLPKNNDLSTTAVLTYNEPFYQAGAKLAYEGSEKYDLELWVINGYNLFADNNKSKSFGLLFSYHLNADHSITYTNLIGNEESEASSIGLNSYHNIYYSGTFSNLIKLTVGADYGHKADFIAQGSDATYYGGLATMRAILTDQSAITVRGEIYSDESAVLTSEGFIDGNVAGLEMFAVTFGYEYKPSSSSYIRFESRYFETTGPKLNIFDSRTANNRTEFVATLGCYLDKSW